MQRTPTRIPPGHPIPAFPECRRRGASSRSPSGKSGLCRRAGRSGICFPTSLCDLIGILAQALARVMEPESQGPDPPPPPRNLPQGPLFGDSQSPGGGRGGSTFSAPRSLQLPPVAATAARSPGTAPPAAGSAPRHPCPARHAPASTTHPGRLGPLKIMQPRCGHGFRAHPGARDSTDSGRAAFGWSLSSKNLG